MVDLPRIKTVRDDIVVQGCYCDGNGEDSPQITCAHVDCFQPRQFNWDDCRPAYQDISSCCFSNFTCGEELQQKATCELEGKTYHEGEKMYPDSDPCTVCHCQAGWDGDLEGEFCKETKCTILGQEDKILRGCQPVQKDNVCCPFEWVCPEELESNSPVETRAGSAIKEEDKCRLPKDVGPCKMIKPMFYFDLSSRSCQSFNYGGCRGNENKFSSLTECEDTCQPLLERQPRAQRPPAPPPVNEVCSQAVAIGPCKSRLEKFYYDQQSGECQKFYYSGCRGGKNMFDTLQDCSTTCVRPGRLFVTSGAPDRSAANPCEQERDVGPCRAAMPRWFYNKQSGSCEEFRYGGCQGNDNNFMSQAECEGKCSTGRSLDINTLPAGLPSLSDPARTRSCPGCPTSTVITPEIKMVAAKGVKKLSGHPAVTCNQCEKIVLKEITEVKTQVVAGINYIFSMKIETRSGSNCDKKVSRTCSDIYIYQSPGCDVAGDCLELVRQDKIRCEEVICEEEARSDEETDPCFQEKMVGRCKGAFNRFYFDAETKTCRNFLYGGCLGNGNNFADERSCQQTCGKHMTQATPRSFRPTPANQICRLPMEAGPCYALKPRFFFNFQSRRCEQFIYGGCRGNENNFQTMQVSLSNTINLDTDLISPRSVSLPVGSTREDLPP